MYVRMDYMDFFLRLLVAGMLGVLIGLEREYRAKEAGYRTHFLVALGSALIMIVSQYGFRDVLQLGDNVRFDPARLAAQVVTGIGFIGAGTIILQKQVVRGLTTAAGIWATAGIGLALGCGMYFTGIFVTLMIGIFQVATHRFTVGADSFTTNRLRFTVREDEEFESQVRAQLQNWEAQILSSSITRRDDGLISYDLTLKMTRSISIDDVDTLMQRCHAVTSAEGIPVG